MGLKIVAMVPDEEGVLQRAEFELSDEVASRMKVAAHLSISELEPDA